MMPTMSHKEKFSFINYYQTDFTIIKLSGGYIVNKKSPNKKFWQFYAIMSNIFCCSVNLAQILHLFELSSIIKLAASGYVIAVSCMGSLKAYFTFTNRNEYLNLINAFQEETFLPKNKYQEKMAKRAIGFYNNVKYKVLVVCTMSVMASMITPLFNYQERRLPFAAWYPFDISPAPLYAFVYIHQCIADCLISCMNLYTDIIVAGFTTFAGIQCDFLCDNLKNLKEHEIEEGLRECIQHHKLILR